MDYLQKNMKWCVWKYIDVGKPKPAKVPYNPITKQAIDVTATENFLPYQRIQPFINKYDGLGVRVSDNLVAIDIDNCIENNKPNTFAAMIVERFSNSYIEISLSGKGLRLFCLMGDEFKYDKKIYKMKQTNLEVYIGGQTHLFVTVTGNIFQKGRIQKEDENLHWLLETFLKRKIKKLLS